MVNGDAGSAFLGVSSFAKIAFVIVISQLADIVIRSLAALTMTKVTQGRIVRNFLGQAGTR